MTISMDTPNKTKAAQRAQLEADVEAFLAAGGTIATEGQSRPSLATGIDKNDRIKSASAAVMLGFSERAILQSFRTGILGGHPAPEYTKHRATGERLFYREAIYRWVEQYGKGGCKGMAGVKDETLLTASEVAALIGRTQSTVSKYKAAGKLPEQVKGKDSRHYWRRSDIEAWMGKQAQEEAA